MRACEQLDLLRVDSPAFIIDLAMLERNLELLAHAQAAAGATILLALKGFAAWSTFPLVGQYLDGVAASGPDEARLGREELGKKVHTYCPAFDEASLRETIRYSDHVIFNSPSQIDRFRSSSMSTPKTSASAYASIHSTQRSRCRCTIRVHLAHAWAPPRISS